SENTTAKAERPSPLLLTAQIDSLINHPRSATGVQRSVNPRRDGRFKSTKARPRDFGRPQSGVAYSRIQAAMGHPRIQRLHLLHDLVEEHVEVFFSDLAAK